jgi:hypothetical protein
MTGNRIPDILLWNKKLQGKDIDGLYKIIHDPIIESLKVMGFVLNQ